MWVSVYVTLNLTSVVQEKCFFLFFHIRNDKHKSNSYRTDTFKLNRFSSHFSSTIYQLVFVRSGYSINTTIERGEL